MPDADGLPCLLRRARGGDRAARERLIAEWLRFIAGVVAARCRRRVRWGHDDELSIGLMAFNEAIDAYDEGRGLSFPAFARLVIQRRLVDYFRAESGRAELISLDEVAGGSAEVATSSLEAELAARAHAREVEDAEREEEIQRYEELLAEFGLSIESVADASPVHAGTRRLLRQVAVVLAGNPDLMEYLRRTRRLPQKSLCKLPGVTPRVLERGRVYIIALALLLSGGQFPLLRQYAAGGLKGEGEAT